MFGLLILLLGKKDPSITLIENIHLIKLSLEVRREEDVTPPLISSHFRRKKKRSPITFMTRLETVRLVTGSRRVTLVAPRKSL